MRLRLRAELNDISALIRRQGPAAALVISSLARSSRSLSASAMCCTVRDAVCAIAGQRRLSLGTISERNRLRSNRASSFVGSSIHVFDCVRIQCSIALRVKGSIGRMCQPEPNGCNAGMDASPRNPAPRANASNTVSS